MIRPVIHVVFGAGQIGIPLARRLVAAGHTVRVVSRSERGAVPGATAVRADASDPTAATESARGAAVLYHCMNPAYSTAAWSEQLPRIHHALVGAARAAGARLVVLGNVYALGRPDGRPLDEDRPASPASMKGAARARADAILLDAHRRGDARVVFGRASDFYGPGGEQTYFGGQFWKPVLAGNPAWLVVNPDTPHTYHYVEDVAAGLATLGAAADEDHGRAWMLPCAPAESTRALVGRMAAALGRPIPLRRVPRLALRAAGLVVPIVRELNEMAYQWEEPFVVDDRQFRARFGAGATPADEGARRTVEWARSRFGAGAGRAA
jgi:nucleoside-diphosphate-sugar epimerase